MPAKYCVPPLPVSTEFSGRRNHRSYTANATVIDNDILNASLSGLRWLGQGSLQFSSRSSEAFWGQFLPNLETAKGIPPTSRAAGADAAPQRAIPVLFVHWLMDKVSPW